MRILLLWLTLNVAACGMQGDLYLPEEDEVNKEERTMKVMK